MVDPSCDRWSQNTNIFKLNKNTIFPFSSSFDPVSSPSNHLLKIYFLHHFLFQIRLFWEKWIILIYHSPYENFLEAGNSQKPLCWIRTTSQVAPHNQPRQDTNIALCIQAHHGRLPRPNTRSTVTYFTSPAKDKPKTIAISKGHNAGHPEHHRR